MPGREPHRLSARRVETEQRRGRYSDGGGLYLQVGKNGSNSRLFRFMLNGQARQMGLGSLHTISLAEARGAALNFRKLLHEGIDPIQSRDRDRANMAFDETSAMTFKQCSKAYICL